MKGNDGIYRVALALAALFVPRVTSAADVPTTEPYALRGTMHIAETGRREYLTVDSRGRLLFVTRITHTMVVDATSGATVADIGGGTGEHGVVLVPSAGRGFISDGASGRVIIFDLKTYAVLGVVNTAPGDEGIVYDSASNRVFVACIDAKQVYPIDPAVNPQNGKPDPPIDLPGQLAYLAADGQGRLYVEVRENSLIAAIDTKTMKIEALWPVAPGSAPAAISTNCQKGYLFIGCHNKKMIVMSTADGKVLADLPIGAGVDTVLWTGSHALASCNDGTLTVIDETSPGTFTAVQTIKTIHGARTMAMNPVSGLLYLPYIEDISPNVPTTNPDVSPSKATSAPRTVAIVLVAPKPAPASP